MTDASPQFIIDETEPEPEQPKAARGPSADDAREWLKRRLKDLIEQALGRHEIWIDFKLDAYSDAPHSAIKVTSGTGKSNLIRQEIARFVMEAKRRKLPHRVLVLLPTHRLADEARNRMPLGITSAIWQGRSGTLLGTVEPMCRNPEAVEAALKIGANVEKVACKSNDACCPFYDGCAYQTQKAPAKAADVAFAAHEILFQVPKALGKGFGLVIIDESFWQDGINTKSRLVIASLADELKEAPVRDRDSGARLDIETMYLRDLIERLQRALAEMPDGYVQRAPLIEAGLKRATQDEDSSCSTARKLEWRRKVETGLKPGAADEERQKAVKQYGFIGRLPRRAAMWLALDDLIAGSDDATGRLRIETSTTQEGPQRYLRLLGRKDIAEQLTNLPLIHADATLPFDLVRHYLPNLRLDTDLNVEAPHMRITQVVGLPVGKASLQALPPGKRSADKEERVTRKRQRLVDAVRYLVAGRRGLVVTYKVVENDFQSIEGVETGHFNAIEGVDRWKDVDVLATIGRPLPRSEDIEHMAAAVTGEPVIAGPMIEQARPILSGNLFGQIFKRRIYAVPAAEMVRQAVTEAAVVQAVGRARGVNRTAANPVEVFMILDDTVTELDVDEVVAFADIEPDAVDRMIARGLVPQWGADAARLYPDLFPSSEAAKKMIQRCQLDVARGTRRKVWGRCNAGNTGTSSYKYISIRECPGVRVARYQPAGRYRKKRLAQIDLAKAPDARAVLEAALGKLVLFEVFEPKPVAGAA